MNPEPTPPSAPNSSPKSYVDNSLSVMQENEVVLFEIKRHPIGIIGIYTGIGILLLIIGALAFTLPGSTNSANADTIQRYATVGFVITTAIMTLYALLATKIYWDNRWIVTSDSMTQVNQSGLFSRQSSQLSLDDIEDVSAEQNGLLTHIFNYGVLKVETAGEHSKFQFLFCPNPNYYATKILEAREALERTSQHP